MKLGVIRHWRCNEDTFDRTLVWLPDDMTEDTFAATVRVAQADYLAFLARFKDEPPPNDYRQYAPIPYDRSPTRSVAEIQAEWAAKKQVWEAWDAERQQARKTFGDYLEGRAGIKRFHQWSPPFEYECDWGHQHGVRLAYDATEYD